MGYPFEFSENKTTEAAGLLLHLKGGRADYLWLIKMLYYIDREAINRWERPVTYDHYNSMDYGPVLMSVYNLILGQRIVSSQRLGAGKRKGLPLHEFMSGFLN